VKRSGLTIADEFETPRAGVFAADKALGSHECENIGWFDRRDAASMQCYGRTHAASGL
jgi:hypothetical protein